MALQAIDNNNQPAKFIVYMIDNCAEDFKRKSSYAQFDDIVKALEYAANQIYHFENIQTENRLFLVEIFDEADPSNLYFVWRNYPKENQNG